MSGLEDLYREIILDHYRSPRNRGDLPTPPAHRTEGFNPLCGDEVIVYVQVDPGDGGGRVSDIRIDGQGCSISQSSASLMSAAIKGKSVKEVRQLIEIFKSMMSIHAQRLPGGGEGGSDDADMTAADGSAQERAGVELEPVELEPVDLEPVDLDSLGELAALQGVVKFPVRIKCATLSWNTLSQGLDEIAGGSA